MIAVNTAVFASLIGNQNIQNLIVRTFVHYDFRWDQENASGFYFDEIGTGMFFW